MCVCLWQNFNHGNVRGINVIFGIHNQLMNSFQMTTKVNGMVTLTVTLTLKIANLDFVAVGGIHVSQAHPFHLSNAL